MAADSKKNQVLWNSGKCGTFNLNFAKQNSCLKKIILSAIACLLAIVALAKKLKKCFTKCNAI